MEPKSSRAATNAVAVLLFTLSLFLSLSLSSSQLLHYQTLTLRPLTSQQTTLAQTLTTSNDENEQHTNTDTDTNTNTLSLTLHHIDTALYTLSNATNTLTPQQLFSLRLRRDKARVNSLMAIVRNRKRGRPSGAGFSSSVTSGLSQGSGEYFTRIGVGTPPRYLYMVLDTGSDVVWIQCAPCRKCYSQSDPIFDPRKSSSFSTVPCSSPLCRQLDSPGCKRGKNKNKNTCAYQVSYGDGSFTTGDFSTETLSFRRSKVPRVALGCGHDNEGLFVGAAGLLGLGRGKLSFPTQAGRQFNRKFSYCLVDRSASSKPSSMVFGDSAVSRAARFAPLVSNPKLDTFYYIELTGISVGGMRVPGISAELFKLDPAGSGGIILDSGTSVTRLTRPAYIALRDAFRVGARGLKEAPEFSLFDTCFDLSGKTEVKVPTVVFHFHGADMALPATNYLIPVDSKGTFCFAFAGTMGGLSIIGNIQQQGFRVIFDLAGSRIGFAPRGCA